MSGADEASPLQFPAPYTGAAIADGYREMYLLLGYRQLVKCILVPYAPVMPGIRTWCQTCRRPWRPRIGMIGLSILGFNWLGSLIPWAVVEVPSGAELSAPTNDVNTTTALALLVSHCLLYTSPSPRD